MNKKLKLIIGIIVFVLLIGGAVVLYNSLSEKYTPEETKEINEDKKDDEEDAEEDDEEVLRKAPDFTVYDLDGNPISLSDFKGKPVVLNFWASWCPPCKGEMPEFQKLYEEMKDEVYFVMVDMVDGGQETVETGSSFIKENGYSFPVYYDTEYDAAIAYQARSLPMTLFIDEEGNYITGHTGMITGDLLREKTEELIKK